MTLVCSVFHCYNTIYNNLPYGIKLSTFRGVSIQERFKIGPFGVEGDVIWSWEIVEAPNNFWTFFLKSLNFSHKERHRPHILHAHVYSISRHKVSSNFFDVSFVCTFCAGYPCEISFNSATKRTYGHRHFNCHMTESIQTWWRISSKVGYRLDGKGREMFQLLWLMM